MPNLYISIMTESSSVVVDNLNQYEKTMKSVAQFDLNDHLIAVFPSITAAENQTKIRHIRECANQKSVVYKRKEPGTYGLIEPEE